jgi:Ni/Fe-hydrogenase b-type cytochrome subunit
MADGEEKKTTPPGEVRSADSVAAERVVPESQPGKTAEPLPATTEAIHEAETAPHTILHGPATESIAIEAATPAQCVAPLSARSTEHKPERPAKPAEVETGTEKESLVRAAYEHPLAIRLTHWVNAVALFVMVTSGLRIFRAFPSFGPKIPQNDFIDIPKSLTLGGWLGGALQWHFTFMWIFAASGILYLSYQLVSGHYRTVLFTPKDIPGVWPMARHYFLFGPKPPATGQYNPLQKLAYTSAIGFGVLSLLTGIVLYKPAQFSWLAFLFGGFHLTRIWHFAAMCGFLSFIPGHLIMVALHGWSNFFSMLSGWKRDPEYQEQE